MSMQNYKNKLHSIVDYKNKLMNQLHINQHSSDCWNLNISAIFHICTVCIICQVLWTISLCWKWHKEPYCTELNSWGYHLCKEGCHLRYSSISTSNNYGIHNLIQWFNQFPCLTFKFSLYNIHTDTSQMEQRSTILIKILSGFSGWREKKTNVDYLMGLHQLYLLKF